MFFTKGCDGRRLFVKFMDKYNPDEKEIEEWLNITEVVIKLYKKGLVTKNSLGFSLLELYNLISINKYQKVEKEIFKSIK